MDSSAAANLGDSSSNEPFDPSWIAHPDGMVGYCSTSTNSTGQAAGIRACGSRSVAASSLTLVASDMPPGQFGYFLMSSTPDSVPGFGGRQGTLCLGQPLVRFAAQITQVDAAGEMALTPDMSNLPNQAVFVAGDEWNFQCWFRDMNPGNTSNTTSGLAITLVP